MAQNLNVNVHRREFQQHKATPNIRLQGTLEAPRNGETWWSKTFKWENLTVAGREVKGFVIPQWAAAILLAAIVGALGFMYVENQSQREMLIRLDQKLSDKNDHDQEYRIEMKNRFDSVDAWQQVTNKNLGKLEARLDEALTKKGKS